MVLLVILLLNGTELRVNPEEIVLLIQAREADDPMKRYTGDVRCVIQTTNRAEFTTREECSSIEKRLEALTQHKETPNGQPSPP